MSKSRRPAAVFLILALILFLWGCSKSETVANAESAISNIGEVSLENREAVTAARSAYDALSGRQQTRVENAGLLFEAEAALIRLEEAQARLEEEAAAARAQVSRWLEGQWVDVYTLLYSFYDGYDKAVAYATENGIYFSGDGKCTMSGVEDTWEYRDGVVTVWDTGYVLDESQNYPILRADDAHVLVRLDLLADVFVTVELTSENVGDYIELVDMPYRKFDEANQQDGGGEWVWLRSKVYQDGLVFLIEDDLSIEVGPAGQMNTNTMDPFGPMWDSILDDAYYANPVKAADCAFGRAKGTLYFVKESYAEIDVTGGVRSVRVLGLALDRWHDPQYIPQQDLYLYY